jgi:hypothetical protein
MSERTPYDGLPYYCAYCGLGYGEWLDCDEDCKLETAADAEARFQPNRVQPSPSKDSPP